MYNSITPLYVLLLFFYITAPGPIKINKFQNEFSLGSLQPISASSRSEKEANISVASDDVADSACGTQAPTVEDSQSKLFSCTVPGCIKTFQRYSSLERHLQYGKCELEQQKETLFDKAKVKYTEKLLAGSSAQPHLSSENANQEGMSELPRGWALKETKKAQRFSDKQKAYLDELFEVGKQSGHKISPEKAAQEMRFAQDFSGNSRFDVAEFLTPSQIQGYFSRKSSKDRHGKKVSDDDSKAAEEQVAYDIIKYGILDECQLQHPIVHNSINLCHMYSKNNLNKLNLDLLKNICSSLELDTSEINIKRKAPYIEKIKSVVRLCTCVTKS